MASIDLKSEKRVSDPRNYSVELISMLERDERLAIYGFTDVSDLRTMAQRYLSEQKYLGERTFEYRIDEGKLNVDVRRLS